MIHEIEMAFRTYRWSKEEMARMMPELEILTKRTLGIPKASSILGISPQGLYKKFNKFDSWSFSEIEMIIGAIRKYEEIGVPNINKTTK